MKMIALGTVHGRRLIKESDPKDNKSKAKYENLIVAPGDTFDTEDFGIGESERKALIASGVAKRKTREIADDGAPEPRHTRAPAASTRQPGAQQVPPADEFDALNDDQLVARVLELKLSLPAMAGRAEMLAALRANATA